MINKSSNQTCKICSIFFKKLKTQTHKFTISCWIRRARYWPIIKQDISIFQDDSAMYLIWVLSQHKYLGLYKYKRPKVQYNNKQAANLHKPILLTQFFLLIQFSLALLKYPDVPWEINPLQLF